ncbi:hypothetical protein OFO03_05510 [Campylobacter sp. JMF_02 ED1]|uniref:hypothetical protein n=1 Tax=unclassified Campylobacter TaxID=2593542 RepID=UPI0022E9E1E9|nr:MULTISPECIES: hypothetical protein [unclassified Campylobacter]MDA3049226.1 hypothetical protein [Campylobacter sp. JMF_15 NE4]MDA3051349.1 hypothetical protein [Campylobacter sp. JMF_02 ED1]MDA3061584.1 hypothetical protein [Campylobacter sp. JMF_14 EL1]MDA3073310.1 hypothetical protein [Campylobacter sp. JMF_10 EL2]
MFFDQFIFFLRKKPFFFWTFFVVFACLYSYLMWLYFIEKTNLGQDIFTILLMLCLIWLIVFYIKFKSTLKTYKFEREKEKFELYKNQIINDFNLDRNNNIFEKIEIISTFVNQNFSQLSLASLRILSLLNKTLKIYISNLSRKIVVSKGESIVGQTNHASNDIKKQNEKFLSLLDIYIDEFLKMNNNKKEQKITEIELERTAEILKKINEEK